MEEEKKADSAKTEHHHEGHEHHHAHEGHHENHGSGEHHHDGHQHHHEHAGKSLFGKSNALFLAVIAIIGIILIINVYFTFGIQKELKKSIEAAKEQAKPGIVELTLINNPKCTDCFDMVEIVRSITLSPKANVTKNNVYDFSSKAGKELVSKYSIDKIPALVLTGEIGKVSLEGFEKRDDALVFTGVTPLYTNPKTGRVEGRVELTFLNPGSCDKCTDLTPLVGNLKLSGMVISKESKVIAGTPEGRELAGRYGITHAPTLILSKEASAYDVIKQSWPSVGSVEKDGSYVLRQAYPPFYNITTGKTVGLVAITYITDKSCSECYNVSVHKNILTNPGSFNFKLDSEEFADISDGKGKALLDRYSITMVPTIVLSGDVGYYPSKEGLADFFKIQKDGSYVFVKPEVVGAYRDITTGKVVAPQQQEAGAQ
ncbi:hypothetical protein HYU10_03315 [Candidatus Woesearchaeota archaeon]|nr:hypothetical protein [Candidatus Woesearchaeota archaeon]MBI2130773.1 hypothetical protein [Candidatus Woesearchaeota archaeon]MBI2661223.1 hypothetical protein [Candidatus Woesearchaeota archaeon]